jgi:hypothetical protein
VGVTGTILAAPQAEHGKTNMPARLAISNADTTRWEWLGSRRSVGLLVRGPNEDVAEYGSKEGVSDQALHDHQGDMDTRDDT